MRIDKGIVYGVVGILIGVVVALAVSPQLSASRAGRVEPAAPTTAPAAMHHGGGGMTMGQMVEMLQGKTGDEFDRAFIEGMIEHHQGAIDMARLATQSAKHEEIRTLSEQIISAQETEIAQMRAWKQAWGY
jgi:uncharacterized protein (DUF305 family)